MYVQSVSFCVCLSKLLLIEAVDIMEQFFFFTAVFLASFLNLPLYFLFSLEAVMKVTLLPNIKEEQITHFAPNV